VRIFKILDCPQTQQNRQNQHFITLICDIFQTQNAPESVLPRTPLRKFTMVELQVVGWGGRYPSLLLG